jgi:hypothetical protein
MHARLIHLGGLTLLLVACLSDTEPSKPDKSAAVDAASADLKPTRDASVERTHAADLIIAGDRAIWYGAQFLTNAHPGWKRTDCLTSGCHPYSTADKPPLYKCASCHGGNGACSPNGATSKKTDHTDTAACTSAGCHSTAVVHPNDTTYTQDVQCVSCHFAKRGGTPDC